MFLYDQSPASLLRKKKNCGNEFAIYNHISELLAFLNSKLPGTILPFIVSGYAKLNFIWGNVLI